MKKEDIKNFKQHTQNSNKGTARGAIQIEESITRFGYGRSILVDKNDVTIAGNHALLFAQENEGTKVRVVETDGSELIVVRRTDLDLETDLKARGLAIADNVSARSNLNLDEQVLLAEAAAGVEIEPFFSAGELEALQSAAEEAKAPLEPKAPEERAKPVKLSFTPEEKARYEGLVAGIRKANSLPSDESAVLLALSR